VEKELVLTFNWVMQPRWKSKSWKLAWLFVCSGKPNICFQWRKAKNLLSKHGIATYGFAMVEIVYPLLSMADSQTICAWTLTKVSSLCYLV